MILSERATHRASAAITAVIADKMKSQGNVNWRRQFRLMDNAFDTLFENMGTIDRYTIASYQASLGYTQEDLENPELKEAFASTEKMMTDIVSRFVSITYFMAGNSSSTVRPGSKNYGIKDIYTSISNHDDGSFTFNYCKELVGLQKALEMTRVSFENSKQAIM